tara:strand:- start:3311 stop:4465 length:1155 start_codon:yes stop_codon:yes gene_type:complete
MSKQKKNNIKNSINLIVKLINEKKIDDAEKIIIELKKLTPMESVLCFNHGIIFLGRNKIKEASIEFLKSIENHNSEKSINAYIETLLLLKDFEKAIKEIDRLFSDMNKSFFIFQRKKIADRKAIDGYQSFIPNIHSKKSDYVNFYNLFLKDKEFIKSNSFLCGIFGSWIFEGCQKNYLENSKIKISIDLLDKAIIENPTNKSYLRNISLALRKIGKPEESINFLKKNISLEKNPNDYIFLGNCYSDLKKYDQAIDSYRKALSYKDVDETAIMNIALCYKELNKTEEALNYYYKIIDNKGNFTSKALNGVAQINLDKNNFALSEKYFKKAIELDPNNFLFKKGLGRLYSRMGRKIDALKMRSVGEGVVVFDTTVKNQKKLKIIKS